MAEYEPYIKSITTVAGVIQNYKQDTKIEILENEIIHIKKLLDIEVFLLNDNELKIINIFITQALLQNQSIDRVPIDRNTIFNLLELDKDTIINSLEFLKSHDFIKRDIDDEEIGDHPLYKLNYEVFYQSDLIEQMFNKSMTYFDITVKVINYLNDNYQDNDSITMKTLLNDLTLNTLLLNPILYKLNQYEAIQFSPVITKEDFIVKSFTIKKPKLLKFKRLNK